MAAAPSSGGYAGFYISLEYFKLVRDTFLNSKFGNFCAILNLHSAGRLSLRGVVLMMKVVLRGHKELRMGFNKFLPEGYEVEVEDEEKIPPTLEETDALIEKLQELQFGSGSVCFGGSGNYEFQILWNLTDDDDLLEEYIKFLPPNMLAIRNDIPPSLPERVETTNGGNDDDDGGFVVPFEYIKLVKDTFPYSKYLDFHVILEFHKLNRLSLRGLVLRMKVLLRGHKELRLGLNKYLPEGYGVDVEDEEGLSPTVREARALLTKIKDRFEESQFRFFLRTYEQFTLSPEGGFIVDIYRLFSWNLVDDDDLFEEFIKFLPPDMLVIRKVPFLPARVEMTDESAGPTEI